MRGSRAPSRARVKICGVYWDATRVDSVLTRICLSAPLAASLPGWTLLIPYRGSLFEGDGDWAWKPSVHGYEAAIAHGGRHAGSSIAVCANPHPTIALTFPAPAGRAIGMATESSRAGESGRARRHRERNSLALARLADRNVHRTSGYVGEPALGSGRVAGDT